MPNSKWFAAINQEQFITDFLTIDPNDLSANINDRVAVPVPEIEVLCDVDPHSFPADKWILSSAVQKLIRRRRPEQAVKVATALHTLDPAYLPRRLRIICLEDIGIGDIRTCFDVLHVFSAQKFAAGSTDQEQRHLLVLLC